LAAGRKIFDGNVAEALQTLPRAVLMQTGVGANPAQALEGLVQSIIPEGEAKDERQNWRVELAAGADAQDVLRACVEKGVNLTAFEPQRRHLHDVFVHLVDQDESKGAV